MQIETYLFENGEWSREIDTTLDSPNTLIIVFGSVNILNVKDGIDDIVDKFPASTIVGCSSSAEIYYDEIFYNSLSVSVAKFSKSSFRVLLKDISEQNSFEVGKNIVEELSGDKLKSIFVLGSIVNVNGSELTRGLSLNAPKDCIITGGLAGDGVEFNKTWLLLNSTITRRHIVSVGLYGSSLRVASGCRCGWSKLGLDRRVTSSKDNVLYSIDNKPALELYRRYLGTFTDELPASGLYFPLMLLQEGSDREVLRAIKAIDEEKNSITLAGSIPQGSIVTFAKANFNELIDGAQEAAESLLLSYDKSQKALCIAINCVARKIVLKQEAEDEIEIVNEILGENVSFIGFYSYGEISNASTSGCDFHNQSMTLMLLHEEDENDV